MMHDMLRQTILQLLDEGFQQQQGALKRLQMVTNCWKQIEHIINQPAIPQQQADSRTAESSQTPYAQSYEMQQTLDEEGLLLYGALAQTTYLLVMEVLVETFAQPAATTQNAPANLTAEPGCEQAPGTQEAIRHAECLLRKLGYNWRLSDNVWAAISIVDSEVTWEGCGTDINSSLARGVCTATVWESVLPASMLAALQAAFSIESPFWSDHCYYSGETPFFSYTYDTSQPPSNIVEAAAQQLRQHPALKDMLHDATHVEWWAHIREPTTWSASAHQLHCDCDERRLRKGIDQYKLVHPLYSSVLFLSTPTTGGPTLFLHQVPGQQQLGEEGWAVQPVAGRYLVFPGNLLHGVLPGRVHTQPATQAQGPPDCTPSHTQQQQQQQQQQVPRITLMLAWWRCPEDMRQNQEMKDSCAFSDEAGSSHADAVQPSLQGCEEQLRPWMDFTSITKGVDSAVPPWALMFESLMFESLRCIEGQKAVTDVVDNDNSMRMWLPRTIKPVWQPIFTHVTHEALDNPPKVQNRAFDAAPCEPKGLQLSMLPGAVAQAIRSSLPGLRFFLRHEMEFNDLYPV